MAFCAIWGLSIILFPFYKGLLVGFVPIAVGLAAAIVVSAARARLTRLLSIPTRLAFIGSITLVAWLLRGLACIYFPLEPANDHAMFYRLAASVASGTGYSWGAGPTAFFPPGMPLLLAAVFSIVGIGPLVAKGVGLAIGTAVVPASYLFARHATSETVARWTSVLVALCPTLVFYSATIGYEPLLAMVVMGWAWITHTLGRLDRGGLRRVAGLGLLCGVGTLIKPICLLLPVISLASWVVQSRVTVALWRSALAALMMMVLVLPWTARNWRALGHPVLVSTNGGFVLYSANHSGSRGIATAVDPLPGEVDEVSRDRLRQQAAVQWILSHPGEWAALAVAKAAYGWGTTSSLMSFVSYDRLPAWQENLCKAVLNVGWGALFLWCALAAWRTMIWAEAALTPAVLFVLYLLAVHLVYEALSRHHVTVLPILCLTASAWLASSGARPARDVSQRNASR